jgi:dienelactone hydrolase
MDPIPIEPFGTWFLNANYRGGMNKNRLLLTITLTGSNFLIGQVTTINGQETLELLDNVSWDANTGLLEFRRSGPDFSPFWEWYRGTIVEGVFVGRYSHSQESAQKPDLLEFRFHVTGWNSTLLDRDIVPRSYDLIIDKHHHARLRIDRLPPGHVDRPPTEQFVGRLKVYSTGPGGEGEEPEYDLEVTHWDGRILSFVRYDPNWTQVYTGTASGRDISGTYTESETHEGGSWSGTRSVVLSYGLVAKTPEERQAWQDRTRRALLHLMMADNPAPITPPIVQEAIRQVGDDPQGSHRDDNPHQWRQNYHVRELHFTSTLPNPYGGSPIVRKSHGFLAIPNGAAPPDGYRAVVVVNGHYGSAAMMMEPENLPFPFPPDGALYWYGNAFARQRYAVLALDIEHRPPEDSEPLYGNGAHYLGLLSDLHPAIKADGFDSDWAEDGERAWDAMRALDFLISHSEILHVDPKAILVTGLSMGGEIATVVAALDPRFAGSIPAGFSPDLDVVFSHGTHNHPCWKWMHADMREYIDTSDLHALIAPRPLIVQTGRQDTTFSTISTPFASDKQVARRSRVAYGSDASNFVHYLHYDHHFYHVGDYPVGDFDSSNAYALLGVHTPAVTEPLIPFSLSWQTDATTVVIRPTLFRLLDTLLDTFLHHPPPPPTYINEFPHPRFIVNFDPNPDDEPYRLDVLQEALDNKVTAIELHAQYRSADITVIWEHDQGHESGSLPLRETIDYILRFKGESSTIYNDHRQFFLMVTPHSTDPLLYSRIFDLLGQYTQHLSTAVNSDEPPRGITVILSGSSAQFYEGYSGWTVNRLCIVEGVDYVRLNDIVNRTRQPFQWVLYQHEQERGQVNTYHNLDVDSFNVRVWDADDDQRVALASGADSVNARPSDLSGSIEQFQKVIQSQAPRGGSPSLAAGESQAALVWRGADSNNLYVALGSSSLVFSQQQINPWGFSRQINLTYLLEDQPLAKAPTVAFTPQQQLVIVYEGTDAQRLWYITGNFTSPDRFLTFQGLQHRLTLPKDAGRRGSNPSVAVGPDGRIVVVYEGTGDQKLWYVSGYLQAGVLEGTEHSLSQPDPLPGHTPSLLHGHTPSIAIDSAGEVIVVYQSTDDKNQRLWYVSGQVDPHSGEIIGTAFPLTEGASPSVTIYANGQVLIAYEIPSPLIQPLGYFSGSRDANGRINGTAFSLTEGNARQGTHPTVSFSNNGFATILYTGTDEQKLWYVSGTIDQTGRLTGQERLLDMSLVE